MAHHDTESPHVHVVLRGVDARGKDLVIDKLYMSHGMRDRARQIITDELGLRTEIDVDRQLAKEVGQERLTSIDRGIESLIDTEGTLDLAAISAAAPSRIGRERTVARLRTLERLRLVERRAPGSWAFAVGWQDGLRRMGERGDVIKRMHAALKGDPALYRLFDAGGQIAPLEGVVRHKGLHDEMGGALYAIVETPGGHSYYIELDRVTADQGQEGDLVRVGKQADSWAKPTDRVIEEVAARNGGIYDPRAHEAQLAGRPVVIAGKEVARAEVVRANVRRLERLARYRLVTREANGTWKVPPDLVQLLKERECVTVQCVACHLATVVTTGRSTNAGVDPATTPGRYASPYNLPNTTIATTNERSLRAFGWPYGNRPSRSG